ncbi:FG-GAP repeat domain-containing protein [Poriferisphaera sp. WC338]|uniref:FG-GAP repeat domain-containing protein n=1 Tax=Poriferisphaera sp. WC338 TaxID=3425129 RepID=UPI003D817508
MMISYSSTSPSKTFVFRAQQPLSMGMIYIAMLTWLLCAPTASGAVAAFESFTYKTNHLNGQGEIERDGWAGKWNGKGFTVRNGKLHGQGHVRRKLISTLEFGLDSEWYFRLDFQRDGLSSTSSDYCALMLTNRDSKIDCTPFIMGITSAEKFYAGAGVSKKQVTVFGKPKEGQSYTMIARLKTRNKEKDELEVWVFPSDQPLPDAPPSKPATHLSSDYSGRTSMLELRTGNAKGYNATINQLIIGDTWQDVIQTNPKSFMFEQIFKRFKPLMISEYGTHMLPARWSNICLVKWDQEDWQILSNDNQDWTPARQVLYSQVDDQVRAQSHPKTNIQTPLFDSGRTVDLDLPQEQLQIIPRPGGGHDMIALNSMTYLPLDKKPYKAADIMAASYKTTPLTFPNSGAFKYVADADGDGVVDLLVGKRKENRWNYWRETGWPWQRPRQQLLGPDRDAAVNENVRGYDVAGNWLGSKVTQELMWAKGKRVNGKLRFGELKPVYAGRDDFPALWRNYSWRLSPGLIELNGQRYIVMLSAIDQVLAAPILTSDDGELRIGKAEPLLAPNAKKHSLTLDIIFGIVDFDNDGVDEIIVGGGGSGMVTALKGDVVGAFQAHVIHMVGGMMAGGTMTIPTYGDWNNDGHNDIIIGDGQGLFTLYPGTNDPLVFEGGRLLRDSEDRVVKHYGTRNIQGPNEVGWGYTQPMMFDWDQDGQQDMITNDNNATYQLFKRISPSNPAQVDNTQRFTHNNIKLPVAWRSRPAVIPGKYQLADDPRPILLYLDIDQLMTFGIPSETGSTEITTIIHPTYVDGEKIQLAWWGGLSGRVTFNVEDWDEDGKWDVVFDAQPENSTAFYHKPKWLRNWRYINTHSPFWLKNVGTNAEPIFERARAIRHVDNTVIRAEGHGCNISTADLNGDGKQLDLIIGDGPGFLYYLMHNDLYWKEQPSTK